MVDQFDMAVGIGGFIRYRTGSSVLESALAVHRCSPFRLSMVRVQLVESYPQWIYDDGGDLTCTGARRWSSILFQLSDAASQA